MKKMCATVNYQELTHTHTHTWVLKSSQPDKAGISLLKL